MRYSFLFVACAFLFSAGSANGQSFSDLVSAMGGGSAAVYSFAEPGDVTVKVKVWGSVRAAGLYELTQGTHLSTLLTIAGGPGTAVRTPREVNTLSIRIARMQDGEQAVIYENEMEGGIFALRDDPVLIDGDIVLFETIVKPKFSWRDVLPFVSAIGTSVLLVDRILRLASR